MLEVTGEPIACREEAMCETCAIASHITEIQMPSGLSLIDPIARLLFILASSSSN